MLENTGITFNLFTALIILERIADALKGKCWPHKQCVEILLTEKTRHLDIGTIEPESADDILKIASIKCPVGFN